MSYKNLIVENQKEIAVIRINRPKALNALNLEVLAELEKAVEVVAEDKDIRVLVLTGEGKAFVAGADIGEMKDLVPEQARKFSQFGQKVFRRIELLEKPTIAAVNGFALGGGCELAMCCDIRIASKGARFGQPEATLGITPGWAGTQRLSRIVGLPKAKELIFTGDMIAAEEALRIGLINRVVADEELMPQTMLLAEKIASRSQNAIKYAKIAMNRGFHTDLDTAHTIESDLFALCFADSDQRQRMAAFLEKKK